MTEIPEEVMQRAAELFKMLGDPTRVQILLLLADKEMNVNDLAEILNKSVSSISHKLRLMRGLQILKYKRDGRNVIYSLADNRIRDAIRIIVDYIKTQ
ncbi:MAG: metalloregulator ArsR/SmtB family transcription factor [Candidatus Korarchaeota archaeon]